jgi:hypothetical protein
MMGPLAGADEDPECPPSTLKNVNGSALGPRGCFSPHSGSERCGVTYIGMVEKKVILLTGLILPALSSVMTDDP